MTPVHIMTIDSEGEAPPIVMLERLGGNSNSFQAMVPALSGFRVVRLDFPGAGRSPKPPQEIIAIGFLVEMLESAAAHLGVQRAHVVGYSIGTLIARHLPARHPQRVTSLTLFGATARHEGMSAVANHLIGSALASAAANDNPMAVAFVRESHMRRRKPTTGSSVAPTVIVTGDEDAVDPPSVAQEPPARSAAPRP
jgi:3-oxoadipate enol-lactonase